MTDTKTIALIAVAAVAFLATRKASAAPASTASIQPPKVGSYLQNPSSAAQYASLKTTGNSSDPVTAGLNFLSGVIGLANKPSNAASAYDSSAYAMRISNGDTEPTDPAYGWQYFTGGTAIDPQGSYYQNGTKVWSPQVLQDNPTAYTSYSDTYGINGF